MGRTDNSAPMEGVAYPHRSSKSSALRRMQSEVQIGSSRGGAPLGSSRSRDPNQPSRGFWNTVLDRPLPSMPSSGSFHSGFASPSAGSSHVQPMQSFHGTTASSSRTGATRAGSSSKRLACPECHQTFSSSTELAAHREKHNQRLARPFQCTQCNVGFSQKSHLNQHVRTVHQKVRPHKCDKCDKAFGKKYDLSSHRDAVHSHERPHACPHCDKKFAKRSNLTRHIDKLHPEAAKGRR